MTKYAIFNKKHDCEIWVTLTEGNIESIPYIKEDIEEHLTAFPKDDRGYCEQYPFYMADWEIVGGKFEPNFDFDQILELIN
jgi:hypothetical protein